MSKSLSAVQIKKALKVIMKKKEVSYSALAEHLKISLPTVKRFMSNEDMSLERLLDICQFLETSLSEIEKIILIGDSEKQYFTEEQELFFSENSNYLSFLFHFYTNNHSVEKIKNEYKLSQKSVDKYLLKLEKLDLIKNKNGLYKPVFKEFPHILPYGLLSQKKSEQVLNTGFDIFKRYNKMQQFRKNEELDKGSTHHIVFCELSRASYLGWYEKYKELNLELQKIAEAQEYQKNIKDKKLIGMMHLHGVFELNDPEIFTLQNMFGRVVELK